MKMRRQFGGDDRNMSEFRKFSILLMGFRETVVGV